MSNGQVRRWPTKLEEIVERFENKNGERCSLPLATSSQGAFVWQIYHRQEIEQNLSYAPFQNLPSPVSKFQKYEMLY
jgi:hypothetical protein